MLTQIVLKQQVTQSGASLLTQDNVCKNILRRMPSRVSFLEFFFQMRCVKPSEQFDDYSLQSDIADAEGEHHLQHLLVHHGDHHQV